MMGVPDGVLCHTQNSRGENRYWYNGVESGEIAQCAAIAGHYGVPMIMLAGDEAACREATHFLGPHCVTVAVKRGVARESAETLSFRGNSQALYEGAKRAVAAIPQCKPFTLKTPIKAKKQWLSFDAENPKGKLMIKESEIPDARHIFNF